MPVVIWNNRTEKSVNQGLPVIFSNAHSLAGLGEDAAAASLNATGLGIEAAVKRVLMEKAALQTGVSVALAVIQAVPVVGQIVAAVYALVQTLFSSKYKAELNDHLEAFKSWSMEQEKASDIRMIAIRDAAWLTIRSKAITLYKGAKAKGVNSSGALAKLSPWWQDLVAKYTKPNSAPTAPGVGELFPTGLSGLAWVGDDEIIVDRILKSNYTGLAHVVDAQGKHYGSVWYDSRLLYPRNGLGDVWSNIVDTVSGSYRTISNKVVALVPKIANFIPPVAAIKYIVVPAMKEVGWEGTATKLENGTTAAGNVAAAAGITMITAGAAASLAPSLVLAPNAVTQLVSAQNTALLGGRITALVKQPVTDLISATGHDTAASQLSTFLDKTSDKGNQYASDPGVVIHDAHTVVDTLTGKEAVTQADDEIAKGKRTLLEALAQRESEAKTQLNSEAFQSTAAGMLTCRMLDDPAFAQQLLQLANQEDIANQQRSSATLLAAAAAAAGGLFLMNK